MWLHVIWRNTRWRQTTRYNPRVSNRTQVRGLTAGLPPDVLPVSGVLFNQSLMRPATPTFITAASCTGRERALPLRSKFRIQGWTGNGSERKRGFPPPPVRNERSKPCWWTPGSRRSRRRSPSPTCSWCYEYRPSPSEDLRQLIGEISHLCCSEQGEKPKEEKGNY